MLSLIEFIRERIRRGGPVPFRWFMQQALYHPLHGYYASGRAAIGRHGDYFTSVSAGPLFGKLLCSQFREMWERMGRPAQFTLVEQGANNGDFAHDVLRAAAPDFFEAIRYTIIEPFPILRERQRLALAGFSRVQWRESLAELEPFRGAHFSNELLDAMPVHLVKFKEGEWRERYVDCRDRRFEFIDGPVSSAGLSQHLKKLPLHCMENYTTEINLDALDWIETLSTRLVAGCVLIADYGWPRAVLYAGDRCTGTLACHSKHRRSFDPLQAAGNADITAHVDFTSLAERAERGGFRVAGFADQHHFMVGLGQNEFPDTREIPNAEKAKALRAFNTLMHPNFMGMSFKFLALEKPAVAGPVGPLAGFQFSTNPRTVLGLA